MSELTRERIEELGDKVDEAILRFVQASVELAIQSLRDELERLRRERETAKEHLREAADYCAMGSPMLARSELAKALALLEGEKGGGGA